MLTLTLTHLPPSQAKQIYDVMKKRIVSAGEVVIKQVGVTHTRTHAHTHARMHTHMHARTHTHARTHSRAYTLVHTHTQA